jgi:hypothetical protein
MHLPRRSISWCLLIVLGGVAVWIHAPNYGAVATIEKFGGTVQILTAKEYDGALAITLPDTVGDIELDSMVALDKLKPVWLQLHGRQISGRGLASLKRLVELRGLTLYGTSITDEDLLHLQAFPKLHTVILDGSRLSAHGLEHLKGLPHLGCVSLRCTSLTAEDVRQFQATMPKLMVLSEFTDPPDD